MRSTGTSERVGEGGMWSMDRRAVRFKKGREGAGDVGYDACGGGAQVYSRGVTEGGGEGDP